MKNVLGFVLAVAVSVELLAAVLSVFDARRRPSERAAAVERLALPTLLWGAVWWFVGVSGGWVLLAAMLVVVVAHVITFHVGQWLLRMPGRQTLSVDTDVAIPDPQKRAPATMGTGKGERNLSPGRSSDAGRRSGTTSNRRGSPHAPR